MRRFVMSFLILIPIGVPDAQADFVVAGPQSPPMSPPNAPSGASGKAQDEATEPGGTAPAGGAGSEEPTFKVAQGFGNHVSLSFAVRQIVPRGIRVTYGPGAAADAVVTWKGGEGWNRVLLRAVHPLGLRLVMTPMAVEIRK